MDMYQKRKMRAENKNNNQDVNSNKVGINCVNLIYENFLESIDI